MRIINLKYVKDSDKRDITFDIVKDFDNERLGNDFKKRVVLRLDDLEAHNFEEHFDNYFHGRFGKPKPQGNSLTLVFKNVEYETVKVKDINDYYDNDDDDDDTESNIDKEEGEEGGEDIEETRGENQN